MNNPSNEKKCCDACLGIEDNSGDGIGGTSEYCNNPECPCHAPPKEPMATESNYEKLCDFNDQMAKKVANELPLPGPDDAGGWGDGLLQIMNRRHFTVEEIKSFIARLLEQERAKAIHTAYKGVLDGDSALTHEMGRAFGAQVERSRIEEAVGKLETVALQSFNQKMDGDFIKRDAIIKVIRVL